MNARAKQQLGRAMQLIAAPLFVAWPLGSTIASAQAGAARA